MNYIPIGSISIFINVSNNQNDIIDDKLINDIERIFEVDIQNQLSKYKFGFDFYVKAESKRGCIIETISVGIILTGVYKFIKDYDKVRNNLKLIGDDLKNVYLRIKGKKNAKSSVFKADDIEVIRDVSKVEAKTPVLFEKKTKKESIIISTHKITIMREDIKEKISIGDIEKLKKKNNK